MTIQNWLEQRDIEKRCFGKSTWIPLLVSGNIDRDGKPGHEGYKNEYHSIDSLIVPLSVRDEFQDADWHSVARTSSSEASADDDSFYFPDRFYRNEEAYYPVLTQVYDTGERSVWHLHQEIFLSLRLFKEKDDWLCPDENYIAVAKLNRLPNGDPLAICIRAEFLRDYLCARQAAMVICAFACREIVEPEFDLSWDPNPLERTFENGEWEGCHHRIHEGGMGWGEKIAVLKQWRESVDPTEDVPLMPHPTEEPSYHSEFHEQSFEGRKLHHAQGRIWWKEWIEPGETSPRIRDDVEPTTQFIVDNQGGSKLSGTALKEHRGWIYFKSGVFADLLNCRAAVLEWQSLNTGKIGPSKHRAVEFGVNRLGLLNVLAVEIGRLPEWVQSIWARYNVTPEGGISEELHSIHNLATLPSSIAPEANLINSLIVLVQASKEKWGGPLFAKLDHSSVFVRRIHRFHDESFESVCLLAKELNRLIVEKIDLDLIKSHLTTDNKKMVTSKGLMGIKVLSLYLDQLGANGRSLTKALAGINELRQGDAHPKSSSLKTSLLLFEIDPGCEDFLHVSSSMINQTAECLGQIALVFDPDIPVHSPQAAPDPDA